MVSIPFVKMVGAGNDFVIKRLEPYFLRGRMVYIIAKAGK